MNSLDEERYRFMLLRVRTYAGSKNTILQQLSAFGSPVDPSVEVQLNGPEGLMVAERQSQCLVLSHVLHCSIRQLDPLMKTLERCLIDVTEDTGLTMCGILRSTNKTVLEDYVFYAHYMRREMYVASVTIDDMWRG